MAENTEQLKGHDSPRTWPQPRTPQPRLEDLVTIVTPGVDMPKQWSAAKQLPVGLEDIWKESGNYCPSCYNVSRDMGIFTDSHILEAISGDFYLLWYVNYGLLADCAERNCQFCCFMLVRLFNDPFYTFGWSAGEEKGLFSCCADAPDHGSHEDVVKAITRTHELSGKHGDTWFAVIARPMDFSGDRKYFSRMLFSIDRTNLGSGEVVQEILGPTRQITLEVSARAGTAAAEYIMADPVNVVPQSEVSLDLARLWINECTATHTDCYNQLDGGTLPTRVLDVSGFQDGKVRLVDGNVPGLYTTLSYCWGGPQDTATTTANLTARQNDFDVDELPQTLRDAIELTSRFPIPYIWIDSLCIVQDSDADKDAELPKMASYYKNAVVTICAGGGKCSDGFLKDRGVCKTHPESQCDKSLLEMPFLCPSGRTSSVLFREYRRYKISQESVSRRAWTFQEKILSPRMLLYGQRMSWHCSALQVSAGGVQDWASDVRSANSHLIRAQLSTIWQRKGTNFPTSPTKLADLESEPNPRDQWYWAVSEYSERVSTFPEDKLRANAALAAEFAEYYQDEYIAGLWRQTLIRDMLWSTWPRLDVLQPLKWRAPSWSWASIEDAVLYDRLPSITAQAAAEVISVSVKPVSPNFPFGEVESAALVIRGRSLNVAPESIDDLMHRYYRLPALQDSHDWRHLMMDSMLSSGHDEDKTKKKKTWAVPQGSKLLVLFAEPIMGPKNKTEIGPTATSSAVQRETSTPTEGDDLTGSPQALEKLTLASEIEHDVEDEVGDPSGTGPIGTKESSEATRLPPCSHETLVENSEHADGTKSTMGLPASSITAEAGANLDGSAHAGEPPEEAHDQVQVQVQDDSTAAMVYGLVLAPVEGSTDTFERIGSFHELKMYGWANFNGADEKVTIV